MSSVKGDYCNVGKFDPSSRTIDAIAEMNRVTDMANLLDRILMVVPFFQVFAGRSTYNWASFVSMGWQVSQSDWNTFAGAVNGIEPIKRAQLERIAMETADKSMGAEGDFWRCVYNAL